MTDRSTDRDADRRERDASHGKDREKSGNAAPDAVTDPNEKTEGKPGVPPGADEQGGETDPGGG